MSLMSSSDILYHPDTPRQDDALRLLAKIIARAIIRSQQSKPDETMDGNDSSPEGENS
jgi:hypothetical protein